MISKRSLPPRPPLPNTRKLGDSLAKPAGQQDDQDAAGSLRKLDFFSIRYSRDDANESDEEISIIRKEDNDEEVVQNEQVQNVDAVAEVPHHANNSPINSTASSLLSTISRPFLVRLPTKSSSEASSFEDKQTLEGHVNEREDIESVEAERCGNANGGSRSNERNEFDATNGRCGVSTAERRNESSTNSVVSSAMSLSSLLKKEVEQRIHLGKTITNDANEREGSEREIDPTKERSLSSALLKSSQLFMPFGINSGDITPEKEGKREKLETDVPMYNILLVSVVAFLFLMLPTSSFANGFVLGGFLTFFAVCALMWLLTPEMSDEERYKRDVMEHAKEMENVERRQHESLDPWQLSKPKDLEVRCRH